MKFNLQKRILILALLSLIYVGSSLDLYKKVVHNTDPEAKCLDGSPALLYIHQGTQKDKFLLYFIGGGFCGETTLSGTLESCYQRSKTNLGSSTMWPDYLNDAAGTQGLISLNDSLYKNWTKILFGYCDGAMFQGDNANPIPYKDTKLYFRGNRQVRSHFKWLIDNYQMDKASKIMLTGGSAGGIASFIWTNYLQSIVVNPKAVYTIPDSGIFINSNTFTDNQPLFEKQISTLMQIAQVSQKSPTQECNKAFPGAEYKCLFIEQNYKFLKGKFLFINSEYDAWAIQNILKIKCLKQGDSGATPKYCTSDQIKGIEDYRLKYMKFINEMIHSREDWGIWSIACSQHVYQIFKQIYDSDSQRVAATTGLTVKDAIQKFILQDKTLWTVDNVAWPGNGPCAN